MNQPHIATTVWPTDSPILSARRLRREESTRRKELFVRTPVGDAGVLRATAHYAPSHRISLRMITDSFRWLENGIEPSRRDQF